MKINSKHVIITNEIEAREILSEIFQSSPDYFYKKLFDINAVLWCGILDNAIEIGSGTLLYDDSGKNPHLSPDNPDPDVHLSYPFNLNELLEAVQPILKRIADQYVSMEISSFLVSMCSTASGFVKIE